METLNKQSTNFLKNQLSTCLRLNVLAIKLAKTVVLNIVLQSIHLL